MLKRISNDEICNSICGEARCIEKIKDNYYSCANYFPVAQTQLEADLKEQVEVCKSCKEYFEFNRLNKVIENMGNRIKELEDMVTGLQSDATDMARELIEQDLLPRPLKGRDEKN